jgi:hypothetical protein
MHTPHTNTHTCRKVLAHHSDTVTMDTMMTYTCKEYVHLRLIKCAVLQFVYTLHVCASVCMCVRVCVCVCACVCV